MRTKVECNECGREKPKSQMHKLDVFDSPFDTIPRTIYVCKQAPKELSESHYIESCDELLRDSSWADFRYFDCHVCNRMICEQNPHNGWHVQYRVVDAEQICLSCYEKDMFENGLSEDDLESDSLHGMFFDESELAKHGFSKHPDFDYVHVTGERQAQRILDTAKSLKTENRKVIINYESMAIGGLEGYISLWFTQADES